ncbi:DtxR family iron (metal) dependent repressor [Anaerobacterium chartisolvens]|uniref:Manganese transport regulator n=1 Tax=Anaerobacterium chartisolvens TaxID=1297424 RepID=A0A369B2A7_9FIRM|nr:iron dependent repressor, metal binding and dimerization domain protein [Anaerobacterium chartisolvens]RCX15551.1 DtxR family iron (metal) dependent repressor [Anaerobacterium chartisolvens]
MNKNQEFHTVRGYQLIEQTNRQLTSAMEDYLEMIYRNILTEGYMRINILADMLNVKPSSATKMVQKLTELGFLKYEKYGIIFLTDQGREIGEFLLKRHNIIEKFLDNIGICDNLLVETELIEHNVSSSTLKRIDLLNLYLEKHPQFLIGFEEFKQQFLKESEIKDK